MAHLIDLMFNLHRASWARGGQWRLEWLSMPKHDLALLLTVAVLVAAVMVAGIYRREGGKLRRFTRWALIGLRLVVLGGVLTMLLEPVLIFRKTDPVPSNVILLIDDSTSMDLHDAYADKSNAAGVAAAAKVPVGKLSEMARRDLIDRVIDPALEERLTAGGDRIVHRRTFASRLLPATTRPAPGDRDATAIGGAIKQAIAEFQGQPIAGVIVVTDGQSNTGDRPEKAAEAAAASGIPVIPVAVGTPQGPQWAAVTKLEVSKTVLAGKDLNPVSVLIDSHGLNQPATVRLERSYDDQKWEEIGRQEIQLGKEPGDGKGDTDGKIQSVGFSFNEPTKHERIFLRATLDGAGGELTAAAHTKTEQVKAINQKLKVLFVAGETFPEVEFLRASLLSHDREQVDAWTWLQSADPDYPQPCSRDLQPLVRLPEAPAELNAYDCIVLYDPDPTAWPSNFGDMLQNFVTKEGGGLIYIAGERNTKDLFDRPDDPALAWLNTLPVVVEPGLYHTDVTVKLSSQNTWKLEVTPAGKEDAVFQFVPNKPEENATILQGLPGMYWHFPVTRARRGATVLAQHGDPRMSNENGRHVLLATELIGKGRTYWVGFDSTYRWRYLDDRFFDSFWAHMVDKAGRNKQLQGSSPYTLTSDRSEYRPGESVTITAHFDHADDAAGIGEMHGEVESDPPVELTLRPRQGDPTTFETTFTADKAGELGVPVWSGENRPAEVPADLKVVVKVPDLEQQTPTVDLPTLQAVARAAGVRLFDLADASDLPDAVKIRRVDRVLEDRQEIWDAPALYGLVFLALVAEWVLRKKVQLV